MSIDSDDVVRTYNSILDRIDEPDGSGDHSVAAAILTLAYAVSEKPLGISGQDGDELSHAICMGIRKGLFGAGASEDTSIGGVSEIAEAIQELDHTLTFK